MAQKYIYFYPITEIDLGENGETGVKNDEVDTRFFNFDLGQVSADKRQKSFESSIKAIFHIGF